MSKKNYSRQQDRVCRRSLSPEAINKEIPEYYSGKRVVPGQLKELERFKDSIKYTDQTYNQRLQYLIWIELRQLKTHPTLLVPGWTDFNIIELRQLKTHPTRLVPGWTDFDIIELRQLKTHPTLLVPGWADFNIRRNAVIVESNIAYLDTIDSPATDLKTAFEILCRVSEIHDRLNLKAVACVFDQSFYAKAMEVFWTNRQLFKHLIIRMDGFHLLRCCLV